MKALFFLVAIISINFFSQTNLDNCEFDFNYRVEHTKNGKQNGAIYITKLKGEGPFTFSILDIGAANKGSITSIEVKNAEIGEEILLIDNLKSSQYYINIESKKSKCGLSGINGIEVN